jgi:hypothetical protein
MLNRKIPFIKILVGFAVLITLAAMVLNWRQLTFSALNFVSEPYERGFYEKNFELESGVIYRKDSETGKRYSVMRHFSDGFENSTTINDLIGVERGWTNFTLQSPKAPTVADYTTLAHQILIGERDFLDNRVEPSSEQAHSGQQSLRTMAVAPEHNTICKASLHSTLLYFVKGDHVWFSAWYYFEKVGDFHTLMDLESTFVRNHPGMRIRLNQGYLDIELAKWVPNPVYRQLRENRILFPLEQWVHLEAHFLLSDLENGIIQLWQDDELIIDLRGKTLPFAAAVYDDLEVGLSSHSFGPDAAILYVDDLIISTERIQDS